MGFKITYNNSCIPQERVDFADSSYKWYLDSDSSRKFSGTATIEPTVTQYGTGTITAGGNSGTIENDAVDFIFIKNTGDNDLNISFGGHGSYINLGAGESFSCELNNISVTLYSTGGTTYEYLQGD